jgi:hypothetical protein
MQVRKRGRPPGVRSSSDDLAILEQAYVWMTWPQNETKSFDELVRSAATAHWLAVGYYPRVARTTIENRLKRLHEEVAADPAKFGFPKRVSHLPIKGRRVK